MQNRILEVVEYNPHWITQFEREQKVLSAVLGDTLLQVDHIGSTSVAGLVAKPIIDILLEVSCLKQLEQNNDLLAVRGYTARGENGIVGRRYFQKGGVQRSHHVHAFVRGHIELKKHRAFRDYLRAFPMHAAEYGRIKQLAAQQANHDIPVYIALKNDFIEKHLAKAMKWYQATV
ncbi:GrpB family protein [Pseudoalteromonas sp. T1lg65]|uniref:GrpB family protein n=1 Tax=Pseudoalteromonas sp. T1lg65 TaxID=2077101 RepID=UPI003F7A45F1